LENDFSDKTPPHDRSEPASTVGIRVVVRFPVILASIARHTLAGTVEGARQGYRAARTERGETVPPHAVDATLKAYRDEGVGWRLTPLRWAWSNAACAPRRSPGAFDWGVT
jgi:hypothetical protein